LAKYQLGFKTQIFRTMTTILKKALFLAGIVYAQLAAAQTRADGMAAMQLEEWDSAIKIFTELNKAEAGNQDLLLSLGNAFVAGGDNTKAAEKFQAAYDAKPEGALAYVALARLAMLKNDVSEADKQLEKAKKNAKKDMVARRQIGETYLYYKAPGSRKPNLTRAEALLKEAYDINSKDFDNVMALAYCYKEIPNGGLATLHYEEASGLDKQNPLPQLMLGKVYKAAKVADKPVIHFNKAIALKPNYSPALRAKAEHLYFARKWEDATQAYKDLVAKGSEVKIEDEMQLANCLFISKDCKGCSELVEKILAKDGSKNYLRRLQAYCDYENGDYERGLKILDEYFKIVSPEKVLVSDYEYHGNLLLKTKGDTATAIQDYRKAINMDTTGGNWKLYKDIAELQYSRKDYCDAADSWKMYFDSLPKSDANYLAYQLKMGWSQMYCKSDSLRYVKAEQTFARITELKPSAAIGWNWAARAASAQDPSPEAIEANPSLANQYGKARVYYEKFTELAGNDKEKSKVDLLRAYFYLSYCYFVKQEKDLFDSVTAKYLELETSPDKIKTIEDMRMEFGKEQIVPANTPTPSNTPNNGGKH
jgi:Tfp pilus assembly protein PilF